MPPKAIHNLEYHSVDRSQNVEASKHLDVRIDKTAPEAVISYDPAADTIVVVGRDGLSGVDPGPIAPRSIVPTTWTDFGSDVAQLQTFCIRDHADNETILVLKVRCSPQAYEVSVVEICYHDAEHSDHEEKVRSEEGYRLGCQPERNTIIFQRLVGRNNDHPVLGVRQIVSLGEGEARTTVWARYDVLDDLSLIVHATGSQCCGDQQSRSALEADIRGLTLLHVATHLGHLKVEE